MKGLTEREALERLRIFQRVDETVDHFVEQWRAGWGLVDVQPGSYAHDSLCDGIRDLVRAILTEQSGAND